MLVKKIPRKRNGNILGDTSVPSVAQGNEMAATWIRAVRSSPCATRETHLRNGRLAWWSSALSLACGRLLSNLWVAGFSGTLTWQKLGLKA